MSRHALEVRDASPDDVSGLLRLWSTNAGDANPTPRPAAEAERALANIAADPDERIVVGLVDGELVAALHLRRSPLSPLHGESVVHTSFLQVLPAHRKHGYARALLDVAVTWAEEKDLAYVSAITSSSSRDTNRFLARLGLGTIATVRVAPTLALRRKLSPERGDARRNLTKVLAERRSLRRQQESAL